MENDALAKMWVDQADSQDRLDRLERVVTGLAQELVTTLQELRETVHRLRDDIPERWYNEYFRTEDQATFAAALLADLRGKRRIRTEQTLTNQPGTGGVKWLSQ